MGKHIYNFKKTSKKYVFPGREEYVFTMRTYPKTSCCLLPGFIIIKLTTHTNNDLYILGKYHRVNKT